MSQTALIALTGDATKILGVWLESEDTPAFRGSPLQLQNSSAIVAAQPDDESWVDWVAQLTARTPVQFWWSAKQVEDDATAAGVLAAQIAGQFPAQGGIASTP